MCWGIRCPPEEVGQFAFGEDRAQSEVLGSAPQVRETAGRIKLPSSKQHEHLIQLMGSRSVHLECPLD
jgi:hypothetical protein